MTHNPRDEIVKIITENRALFEAHEHIEALIAVTVEDLIAGGVDQVRVMAAVLRAWTRLENARVGTNGVVQILRDLSDALERRLLDDLGRARH